MSTILDFDTIDGGQRRERMAGLVWDGRVNPGAERGKQADREERPWRVPGPACPQKSGGMGGQDKGLKCPASVWADRRR